MSEEGFLSRWSRRKRGLEVEAPEPAAPPPAVAEVAPAEPEFDLASLPPVESLDLESDFSVFLRPQVPAFLRQAALRRMWSLDPAIRDFTGPAEYAWDFNAPDGVPGFATELSEDLGRRLAQALSGLPAPAGEAAEAPPQEAPALPAEAAAMAEALPPPEAPVRLSAAEPMPAPAVEAPEELQRCRPAGGTAARCLFDTENTSQFLGGVALDLPPEGALRHYKVLVILACEDDAPREAPETGTAADEFPGSAGRLRRPADPRSAGARTCAAFRLARAPAGGAAG